MFNVKILADSIGPTGVRLTTAEITLPRCILAEFHTHRRILADDYLEGGGQTINAASSRAIPTEKLIQRVLDDPFVPEFRENKKGMQAGEALDHDQASIAKGMWLQDRDCQVECARAFHQLNIHKQYVNRLIEPWMWCTIIVTATDWSNMFHLRTAPTAEPSFQTIAKMFWDLYSTSEPRELKFDEWHLPLIERVDWEIAEELRESWWVDNGAKEVDILKKVSVGRCARISYLTHDGKRDVMEDIRLCEMLAKSGHWSPFEHVCTPAKLEDMTYRLDQLETGKYKMPPIVPKDGQLGYCGPYKEWKSLRRFYPSENITKFSEY
jgi:hypothetical protein